LGQAKKVTRHTGEKISVYEQMLDD